MTPVILQKNVLSYVLFEYVNIISIFPQRKLCLQMFYDTRYYFILNLFDVLKRKD